MSRCKKTDMLTQAIKKAGGGKVQTSSDTARKLAKEMGGMKKGGAAMPREGISTRPTGPGGRPLTLKDLEKANRDTGGMTAAQIKAAGEAIKRGNRTPYEPIPKKAKGGMLGKVVQAAAKQGAEKAIGGMLGNLTQSTAKPIGKVVKAVANRAAAQPIGRVVQAAQAKQGAVKPAGGMLGRVVQAAQAKQGAVGPIGKLTQSAPQPTAKPSGGMFSKLAQALPKQGAVGPIGKIVSNPAATQRLPTPVPVAKAPADRALARQEKPEMKPVRRAKGGAGKVRKGMMSKSGDILQAVKPKKGIGGIM